MPPLNLTRARISAPHLPSGRTALRYPLYTPRPTQRNMGRLSQGTKANNFLEDPAQDMGGPGGQELYPVSNVLHKRFASITAAGVMTACAVMYAVKRLTWTRNPDVVHVLTYDSTKGELGDVMTVPVRVRKDS